MGNNTPSHLITTLVGAGITATAATLALWSWWRLDHPQPGIDIIPVFTMVLAVYTGLLGIAMMGVGLIWGRFQKMRLNRQIEKSIGDIEARQGHNDRVVDGPVRPDADINEPEGTP